MRHTDTSWRKLRAFMLHRVPISDRGISMLESQSRKENGQIAHWQCSVVDRELSVLERTSIVAYPGLVVLCGCPKHWNEANHFERRLDQRQQNYLLKTGQLWNLGGTLSREGGEIPHPARHPGTFQTVEGPGFGAPGPCREPPFFGGCPSTGPWGPKTWSLDSLERSRVSSQAGDFPPLSRQAPPKVASFLLERSFGSSWSIKVYLQSREQKKWGKCLAFFACCEVRFGN